jgi:Fe2+ transport system protein FeoA
MSRRAISLAEAAVGTTATVMALRGGAGFQDRVVGMGLHAGSNVEVLVAGEQGRMLVAVGDTRIALGHGMAEKIIVRVRDAG